MPQIAKSVKFNVVNPPFGRVLVTGGAGFVGSHLLIVSPPAESRSLSLMILIRSGSRTSGGPEDRENRVMKGDVTNFETSKRALEIRSSFFTRQPS